MVGSLLGVDHERWHELQNRLARKPSAIRPCAKHSHGSSKPYPGDHVTSASVSRGPRRGTSQSGSRALSASSPDSTTGVPSSDSESLVGRKTRVLGEARLDALAEAARGDRVDAGPTGLLQVARESGSAALALLGQDLAELVKRLRPAIEVKRASRFGLEEALA